MIIQHNETHQALMQALAEWIAMPTPTSGASTTLMKVSYPNPFIGKKWFGKTCVLVFHPSGGLHGDTMFCDGFEMAPNCPNLVQKSCLGLVDDTKIGNNKLTHHFDIGV